MGELLARSTQMDSEAPFDCGRSEEPVKALRRVAGGVEAGMGCKDVNV